MQQNFPFFPLKLKEEEESNKLQNNNDGFLKKELSTFHYN